MNKKMTLDETVEFDNTAMMAHIGAGGDAHSVADAEHNGFLAKKDFIKFKEATGDRTIADYQGDVLALPAGNYEINKPVNAPDTAVGLCEVNVSTSYDGRKQIELLESGTGRMWYYNTHTGGKSVIAGWVRVFHNYKLWEGDVTENNQELHLNMPAGGFEQIAIRVKAYDGTIKIKYFGSGYYRIGLTDTVTNINTVTTVDSRIQLSPRDNKQDWLITDVRAYRHNVDGTIDDITNTSDNNKLHVLAIWGVI